MPMRRQDSGQRDRWWNLCISESLRSAHLRLSRAENLTPRFPQLEVRGHQCGLLSSSASRQASSSDHPGAVSEQAFELRRGKLFPEQSVQARMRTRLVRLARLRSARDMPVVGKSGEQRRPFDLAGEGCAQCQMIELIPGEADIPRAASATLPVRRSALRQARRVRRVHARQIDEAQVRA